MRNGIEFDCVYCGKLTEEQEDGTWACVNPNCWASKTEVNKFVMYKGRELPLCPRCNHKHRLMKRKDISNIVTKFFGFIEYHNDRTLNDIMHHSECSCYLKDKWLNETIPMDKCPYCNCSLHYDLLEEEYTL